MMYADSILRIRDDTVKADYIEVTGMELAISCIVPLLFLIYLELRNITHELHEIAKHTSKEYKI